MFASNGFAMLACWSFPLHMKQLKPSAKQGFIWPKFMDSLSIGRRGCFVFIRCLFDSNELAMVASLLVSLSRKRHELDPKYKLLCFILASKGSNSD